MSEIRKSDPLTAGDKGRNRGPSSLLLSRFFASHITSGSLEVAFADGSRERFGTPGSNALDIAIRFADARVPREILLDLGRRGMVGGQEDMIESIALEMLAERGKQPAHA